MDYNWPLRRNSEPTKTWIEQLVRTNFRNALVAGIDSLTSSTGSIGTCLGSHSFHFCTTPWYITCRRGIFLFILFIKDFVLKPFVLVALYKHVYEHVFVEHRPQRQHDKAQRTRHKAEKNVCVDQTRQWKQGNRVGERERLACRWTSAQLNTRKPKSSR